MNVFPTITVSALAQVLCVAIGLRACVPLTNLVACKGFGVPVLLPWRALGRKPSWWWCRPCRGGFCDNLLPVGPGADRAKG
jgi:hypothetical protein